MQANYTFLRNAIAGIPGNADNEPSRTRCCVLVAAFEPIKETAKGINTFARHCRKDKADAVP